MAGDAFPAFPAAEILGLNPPPFRAEAGRDPASLSVTLGAAPEDLAVLRRNRDLGVARMTVRLPPAKEEEILPILDRWAKLIPHVSG